MKRQPNNNGGFSLLEVILAMAILAIISIPLLSYFTQSMKYNAMMADKQHATNLAQEVLEDLKNQKELAAVTNKGAIYQDSFKLPAGSVAPLVASSGGVRKVDLTVCVYKKGKGGNNPDKEKYRYITVSTSKGE